MIKVEVAVIRMSVCLALMLPSIARSDEGVWSETNIITQVNVACTRVYKCVPAEDIIYDSSSELKTTPPKLVAGICSAGAGPIDGCNECLTTAPNTACEWHLEKKK